MKKNVLILSIIGLLVLSGCQSVINKPDIIEEISADELTNDSDVKKEDVSENDNEHTSNQDEVKEDKQSDEQEEVKKYIGQAFDSDGIVEIYKGKDKNSEIIYKMKSLEQVELIETLPYGWFKVRLEDGTEGYGDARLIRTEEIPPHEYDENQDGYVLIFNHETQYLQIFKDGKLILKSIASSGLWDHFTPKGIFQVEEGRRGKWAYIPRFEQGFKYWVGFKHVYLMHSIPFDENKNIIQEEAAKLGQPASHGCIRLPVQTAEYIYENVPEGSMVLIY